MAFHQEDIAVGPVPSDGAHAKLRDIKPLQKYFKELVVLRYITIYYS